MKIKVKSREEIQKLLGKNNYSDGEIYSFSFCRDMFDFCGKCFEAIKDNNISDDRKSVYLIRHESGNYALYKEWIEIVPSIIEVDEEKT